MPHKITTTTRCCRPAHSSCNHTNCDQPREPSQSHLVTAALPAVAAVLASAAVPAAAWAAGDAGTAAAHYVPSPLETPSWEIWVGFVAGVVPFAIASYEFGKRVLIQRRCPECNGRGLVQRGRYMKKCTACGGMLPWLGWRAFWFSNLRPGNGGPLLQPRGQTSVFYTVPPPREGGGGQRRQEQQTGPADADSEQQQQR